MVNSWITSWTLLGASPPPLGHPAGTILNHVVYTTGTDFLMVNADESKTQAHKMNNRRFSWEILSFIDIMRDFLSVRFFEICLKTDVQVIATWGDATAAGVSRRRTLRSVIIST
jgi:hypothetical protein